MKKNAFLWPILVGASFWGCNGDSNDLSFSIFADPVRLHAPGSVSFNLVRDDGKTLEDCDASWDFKDGVRLLGSTEVSHDYKTPGQYDVSIHLSCGALSQTDHVLIEVFDPVDLAISALEARPLDVSSDGKVTVSFMVSNESEIALQVPTYIDVYLTPSSDPEGYKASGADRIFRYTLESLPASGTDGAVSKLEFDIPMSASVRTGSYYLAAVVNPDHNIGELSDANNVTVTSQPITVRNQLTDGADFTPVGFTLSPSKTSVLSAATAQLRVLNLGSTTAEDFKYEIWIGTKDNAIDMIGATKIHEGTISGGMSGVEQQVRDIMVSVTPTVTDPGLYYFWVVLDSSNDIIERDEENNTMRSESPIQVTDESVLDADIMVSSVAFTPSSTSPGGSFTTTMNIYNQGNQQTGSFICTIFLSPDMSLEIDKDYIVGSTNIDDLLPKETQEISAIAESDTGIPQGEYWVFVLCDSSGVVNEANEDNNIYRSERQLVITGKSNVDLLFGQINLLEGSAASGGENLKMSVSLCNNGTTPAGPSQVAVTQKNLCNQSERELTRIRVDGLEANTCANLYINEPITCDFWCPSYQLNFQADAGRVVAESNENNNATEFSEIIDLNGADCVCSSDKYEPNDHLDQISPLKHVSDDLNLCLKETDLFLLDMSDGDSFEAHLHHDSSVDQLKMELLRGSEVAQSFETGDDLYLSGMQLRGLNDNPAYIRIKGSKPTSNNRYHLDLDTYGKAQGADLAISNLVIEKGALNTSSPQKVTATISNLGSEKVSGFYIDYYVSQSAAFDSSSWRISRQQVPSMATGSSATQNVSLILPEDLSGGTYYLIAKIDESTYTDVRPSNNITRTDAWKFEKKCSDSLDPNDSITHPKALDITDNHFAQQELTVCQTNPDFYAIDLKNGNALDITVTGKTSGDFDLYLYDVHGNVVDSSRTTSSTEKIHRDVIVGDQTLILEVRLLDNIYNAEETEYSMDIRISDAPAYMQCNSVFEPNNFLSSSWDLKSASSSGLTAEICPASDEDYYSIQLTEGERLQVGFETQSTLLRAALYNEENTFLAMLTNLPSQTFDYMAPSDGTYYVRVFINASSTSDLSYKLKYLGAEGNDMGVHSLKVSELNPYAGQNVIVSFVLTNHSSVEL